MHPHTKVETTDRPRGGLPWPVALSLAVGGTLIAVGAALEWWQGVTTETPGIWLINAGFIALAIPMIGSMAGLPSRLAALREIGQDRAYHTAVLLAVCGAAALCWAPVLMIFGGVETGMPLVGLGLILIALAPYRPTPSSSPREYDSDEPT